MKPTLQALIKGQLLTLFLLLSMYSLAQTAGVKGMVTDSVSQKSIRFVNVILKRNDNTDVNNTITDELGNFKFTGLDCPFLK